MSVRGTGASVRTVEHGFEEFHRRLTPSSEEQAAAKSHRETVYACLDSKIGLSRFFRSGSYGNGTSVRQYSDVDYFASIKPEGQRDNSTMMLGVVRDALRGRFPSTPVNVRGPAVRIDFGSDGSERYEVVPSYFQRKDEEVSIYKIPDGAAGWQVSSPETHNLYVSWQNDKLDKELKPVIRFVKAWKFYNSASASSFYLELRTTKYAEGEKTIVYSIDVLHVLQRLLDDQLTGIRDPMGVSGLIAAGTPSQRAETLPKLRAAVARAMKARQAEEDGKISEAFGWWDKVFSGHFPSYYT